MKMNEMGLVLWAWQKSVPKDLALKVTLAAWTQGSWQIVFPAAWESHRRPLPTADVGMQPKPPPLGPRPGTPRRGHRSHPTPAGCSGTGEDLGMCIQPAAGLLEAGKGDRAHQHWDKTMFKIVKNKKD